ncbi:MAG TPA: ribonuclease J, partial [Rhizobiales bacterium]|nr:ribonuclease J [Hyphomicrobiales bacterium]
KFGDERDPGIDVMVPDTTFIESERHNLLGIVLTHAHEDHLGAVAWLWPRLQAPVYCTPFAAELLKGKLEEAGLLNAVPLRVQPMGARFSLGEFDIELVSVTHSIPEPNSVVLRTPAGTIVHSGDWKIDATPAIPPYMDEKRLREIGDEGVDVLVCDSTNVLSKGASPSEAVIAKNLEKIIRSAKKRVAVTTFASHVGRLTSIVRAARAAGRDVVLSGRAMHKATEAAREVGLLKDAGYLLDQEAYNELPRDKVVLVCTGSQGEGRAAMARIAAGRHPVIKLDKGDVAVFSSKTIPGNEKAVAAVLDDLAEQGVEVITSSDALIHTSGHPRQDELIQYYSWLKPAALVPMHGEMHHLEAHVKFAMDNDIEHAVRVTNGEIAQLLPGPVKIIDDAPCGRTHIDGRLMVTSVDGPARKRRKLSFAGLAAISLSVNGKGRMRDDPQIVLDGIPETDEDGELIEDIIYDEILDAFDAMPAKARLDDDLLAETIRRAARRAFGMVWGKKPVVHVLVHHL